MNALLNGTLRTRRRAAAAVRRRLRGAGDDDSGFVLLESIIAITLITVIMAAIGVEYVAGLASVARQRSTQTAVQLADSALEQVRALRPSDVVTGRDAASVATQFTLGAAVPAIAPWLQKMDQASDPTATAPAGATATVPTCNPVPQTSGGPAVCTQKPGAVAYTVSQFLGTCWLVSAGSSSDCVPAVQKTPGSVQYLRVVVSVGWISGTCLTGCYYVTDTLISADADNTFKANQPPSPSPVIAAPGDQRNDVGDVVSLQLNPVTGTGTPAYGWAITSGSLPAGLSMNTSGLISGVVNGAAGTTSVTVQLTDGYKRTDTATFSWTVFPAPTISAPPDQTTAINAAVSLQLTTTCANTPCTYTLNNAPAGLTVSNTGLITGNPSASGSSTVTVSVTDAAKTTVTSNSFTWTVLSAAPTCPTAVALDNGSFESPTVAAGAGTSVAAGTFGSAWQTNDRIGVIEYWANGGNSQAANGGTPVSAPVGTQWIELNASGMDTIYQDLRTTPGQVLQWSLWHRARNATGNVNAQDSIQVQIGSTSRQAAQVPVGSTSATISDGAAGWVQYAGVYTVPSGQTTTRFQVAATATSSGDAAVGNFLDGVTVTGTPCLTAQPAAQTSTVNTPITALQLNASQGSSNYRWSGGPSLPAGLTLSASGSITGTPTAVGTTRVTLIVTDPLSSYQQSVSFTWTVYPAPTVTAPGNQTTSVGAGVSLTVGSTCPDTPCSYSATGLPAGVSINSTTAVISGTPSAAGTTGATVTIRDASGATATSSAFGWTVYAAPTVTNPGNKATTVGIPVVLPIASTCANAPCSFTSTPLPPGLAIDSSTGTISGTASAVGSGSLTVTIRDAAGVTASATFTGTVYAAPTITTPANQVTSVGAGVSLTVGSSCPNVSCTYTASGLPAGLGMSGATITGTPTTAGSASATVTVRDASGATATTASFSWTVYAAPTIVSPGNQTTSVGAAVNLTVASSCPNATCTYSVSSLPAGLNNTGATITGTPTTAGTLTSTVTIRDAAGSTATTTFSWTVKPGPTVTTPANQTTSVGVTVGLTVGSTCPNASCSYSATGLPAGLAINPATGVISGTASTAGTYSAVTVTVTDAAGATATSGAFTWTVFARPTITSPGNQVSTINRPVSVQIPSSCANSPCGYTISGQPAGLTIGGTTGIVTGTPTTLGTSSNVTVTITDAAGGTTTTSGFTWTVTAAPTITTPANQRTSVGATVNLSVGSTCPNTPCTYGATGLPGGLTIDSLTGVISGTPTTAGTYSAATVKVTDPSGATATTSAFSWTVFAQPTLISPGNRVDTVNRPVSVTVASTCANTPCRYAITGQPPGLTIGSAGVVTGTPTVLGTAGSVTVTITDAAGATATTTFGWQIVSGPTITTPSDQVSALGSAPTLTVASTCPNSPCSYAFSNGPAGLSLNATGTVTGTTSGTSKVYSSVTVTVTDASGTSQTTASFKWAVTTTFAEALNNVGITKSTNRNRGNFDGSGSSYSYESILSNGGPAAGARFTVSGATYVWPTTAGSGSADNVLASGQVIAYGGSGSTTLSFLVAGSGSASGNGTITYADGTTQTYTLSAPDWKTTQPTYAIKSVQNTSSTTTSQTVFAVVSTVSLNSTKAISYITLPAPTVPLHVFGISQPSLTSAFNNVGIVTNSNLTSGNFDSAGNTISYEGILANGGPAAGATLTAQGVTYAWPSTAGTGAVDNIAANGQTLTYTAGGGSTLGFLVSATYGPATASGTITFTDNSTQTFTLSAADWVATSTSGFQVAFTGANRNSQVGGYSPAQPVNIDDVNVAVPTTKTIASITLPNKTNLHIFAIGYH